MEILYQNDLCTGRAGLDVTPYHHLKTQLSVKPLVAILTALVLVIGCAGRANHGRSGDVHRTGIVKQSRFEICSSVNPQSTTREEGAVRIASELTSGATDGLSPDFRVLGQEINDLRERKNRWQSAPDDKSDAAFKSVDRLFELAKIYGDLAVRYDVQSRCERPPDIHPAGFRCEPLVIESIAAQYWESHIKTLLEVRNNHPEFEHYDEILFTLGFRIETLGWRKNPKIRQAYLERARVFYMELVENHPGSRFIPLAWFLFAEYYLFDADDFDRALRGYEMAAGTDNPLLPVIIERKALAACLMSR